MAVLHPTPWQRKTLWNAITCLALLVIAGSVICTVYVASRVLLFLQPLLLPVAIAGVLAYLLEPVVTWLARRGLPRLIAVIIVFALFIMSGALLLLGIGPNVYNESQKFSNALPGYFERSWSSLDKLLRENLDKLPQIGPHPAIPVPRTTMFCIEAFSFSRAWAYSRSIASQAGAFDAPAVWMVVSRAGIIL